MWSCEKIKKMMNVKKKENRRTEKFNFGKEKDWFASMNLYVMHFARFNLAIVHFVKLLMRMY